MMSLSPEAYALARKMMVDSQLRPNKVMDARVLDLFGSLPRERFVPAALTARAYTDENIRLGADRVMLAPMVLARMIQDSAIQDGEKILLVGAGTGYGAAVLAGLDAQVTALESDASLAATARPALAETAASVKLVQGSLAAGWAAQAPYDVIFIEGAADFVPEALSAQLAESGRVVLVSHDRGRIGAVAVGVRSAGALSFSPKFDCVAPVLPGLAREAAFVF